MNEPDKIGQIVNGFQSLQDAFEKRERCQFAGIYQLYGDAHALTLYLLGLTILIKLFNELANSEKGK